MAEILGFIPPRLERMAENLWLMRLDDSPQAMAQRDRLIADLRRCNMIVPQYMKGENHAE